MFVVLIFDTSMRVTVDAGSAAEAGERCADDNVGADVAAAASTDPPTGAASDVLDIGETCSVVTMWVISFAEAVVGKGADADTTAGVDAPRDTVGVVDM